MNKLRLLNILVITFLLPIVICCKQESVKPKKYQKQVNFIILLDLSDRIIKSNDQVNRDIKIIENIFYLFEKEVQKKAYIKSKDQFQIIISFQKNSTIDKNEYEDKFYINLKNEKIATKRKKVLQVSKNLHNNLVDLYKNAKFSSKPEDYSGADIWKYFNEDLKSDLITTTDAKNILVIISDGQLIVNGKDRVSVNQSIQQVDNEFNNLSVALLEIVPSETDYGYSQLTKGWYDWFETMKIYNSYFDKKVSINNVNDGLKTFIEDCISHKGDFEKKNVEKFKKKKIKIISIKKPSTEKLVNVKKGFKEKKEIVLRNLVNYSSSSFKYYNSIKTLDEKTKFAISNIINLNESKYTTSELKIIASDLYEDLILNFPTKNQITKYSYCCSSKEKIKSFLEEYNFYTKDIEQNFKTNCPK
jgi:hypothetical protein